MWIVFGTFFRILISMFLKICKKSTRCQNILTHFHGWEMKAHVKIICHNKNRKSYDTVPLLVVFQTSESSWRTGKHSFPRTLCKQDCPRRRSGTEKLEKKWRRSQMSSFYLKYCKPGAGRARRIPGRPGRWAWSGTGGERGTNSHTSCRILCS